VQWDGDVGIWLFVTDRWIVRRGGPALPVYTYFACLPLNDVILQYVFMYVQ
jgi:hypothetical protein